MFKLDMDALKKSAAQRRLMANPANVANLVNAKPAANDDKPLAKLAGLATLAISQDLQDARLMNAAMQLCDRLQDSATARQEMCSQVKEMPLQLRQDLHDYLISRLATLHRSTPRPAV